MKITFLTSGAEPGRDGVGDYTRALADECVRLGNECSIFSLNDRYVQEAATSTVPAGTGNVTLLRLPVGLDWARKIELVSEFNSRFQPDWFSLQFVPYGYNPKGIIGQLGERLKEIIGDRPLHVMFHELWIGESVSASVKHRLVGMLQRRCILKMLRVLKPQVVSTSNPVYVALLERHGIKAALLPLFGNIPWIEAAAGAELPAGFPVDAGAGSDRWIGLFFGSLQAEWQPEPLFRMLLRATKQAGRRLYLVSVGSMGESGENVWKRISAEYAGDIAFTKLGRQSDGQVSHLLQVADFGIASSPLQLIGKSSAAASMIDHGLPVIVNRDDWKLRGHTFENTPLDAQFIKMDGALESKLAQGLPKRTPRNMLKFVAGEFLTYLNAVHPRPTPP